MEINIFYYQHINYIYVLLFLIAFHLNIILCIYDNYASYLLEDKEYELLDVTDNHNLKLIASSSKNIYKGIAPSLSCHTEAELIIQHH